MAEGDGILRALGRLEGRLASLEEAFRDERNRSRGEHEKMISRLDTMEDKLTEAIEKTISMQSQIYSNKHGIEGANKDLEGLTRDMSAIKMIYSRGLGAWAVISVVIGIVASGVMWALFHISEVAQAARVLFTGKT